MAVTGSFADCGFIGCVWFSAEAVFLRQQKAAELEGEEKCPDKSSPLDGDWRTTGVENEVIDGSAIDAPPSDFR